MVTFISGLNVNFNRFAYIINDVYRYPFFPLALLKVDNNTTKITLLSIQNGNIQPKESLEFPTEIIPIPPFGFVVEGKLYISPVSISGINQIFSNKGLFSVDFPYKFYTRTPNLLWIFERMYLQRDSLPYDVIKTAVNTLIENSFRRSVALVTNLNILQKTSIDTHISIFNYESKYSFSFIPYEDVLLPMLIHSVSNLAIPVDYEMIEVDIQRVFENPEYYTDFIDLEHVEVYRSDKIHTINNSTSSPYYYDFAEDCSKVAAILKLAWAKQNYGDVYIPISFVRNLQDVYIEPSPSPNTGVIRISDAIERIKEYTNLESSIDSMKEYALSYIEYFKYIDQSIFNYFKDLLTIRFLLVKINKLWIL